MRALSLRGPRDACVVEVATPSPGPEEVLVRIEACGVCGSDLNAWRGVAGIEYPLPPGAPGHETLGSIVTCGPDAFGLRAGDRVTGLMWNGFAEFGVGLASNLVVVPQQFTGGPLLGEPLACAMNVVRRSRISAGDRVCLVGFGYLAALVAQLLPEGIAGWIAVSRREDSRALALKLGAEAAYAFSEVPSHAWDSCDVVIEAAGVQETLDFATWLTAYGGRLVIAGYHADGPRTVNMQSWNWKGIDVINAHERQPSVYVQALSQAFSLLEARPLVDMVTHRFGLGAAAEAFRMSEERPGGFMKALICP